MATPSDRKYTKEHEWVLLEKGDTALVGVTHYAQDQLGDVVYLSLPPKGAKVTQTKKLGEVESVKAVSDIYSPVSGEVVDTNQEVVGKPELVNQDPYGRGWLLKVKLSNPKEVDSLLTAQQYDAFLTQMH